MKEKYRYLFLFLSALIWCFTGPYRVNADCPPAEPDCVEPPPPESQQLKIEASDISDGSIKVSNETSDEAGAVGMGTAQSQRTDPGGTPTSYTYSPTNYDSGAPPPLPTFKSGEMRCFDNGTGYIRVVVHSEIDPPGGLYAVWTSTPNSFPGPVSSDIYMDIIDGIGGPTMKGGGDTVFEDHFTHGQALGFPCQMGPRLDAFQSDGGSTSIGFDGLPMDQFGHGFVEVTPP